MLRRGNLLQALPNLTYRLITEVRVDPGITGSDQRFVYAHTLHKNNRDKPAIFIMIFRHNLNFPAENQISGKSAGLRSVRLTPFRGVNAPDPNPDILFFPPNLKGVAVNNPNHLGMKGRLIRKCHPLTNGQEEKPEDKNPPPNPRSGRTDPTRPPWPSPVRWVWDASKSDQCCLSYLRYCFDPALLYQYVINRNLTGSLYPESGEGTFSVHPMKDVTGGPLPALHTSWPKPVNSFRIVVQSYYEPSL